MKISQLGVSLIKRYESLRLKAYRCPAGIWTIGYGHTGNVKPGDVITVEVAVSLLMHDIKPAEEVVNRLCPNVNQNQFDALVSFVFNAGEGNFINSTLLKKVRINANDPSISEEFKRWVKASGESNGKDDDGDGLVDEAGEKQRLEGLIKRRNEEATLYFQ